MTPRLTVISIDDTRFLLRRAGHTMRQMPGASIRLGLAHHQFDTIDDWQAYGYTAVTVNRTPPSSADISLMDTVMCWLTLIPQIDQRTVVAHRMIWDPDKARSHWSYKRLAAKLHTSPTVVKHKDLAGITRIATALPPVERQKVERYLREADGEYGGYVEAARDDKPRGAGIEFYSRVAA